MHSELAAYLERIEDLRRLVQELVTGLPTEALNWCPIEGSGDHATNSMAVLATHIAGAERFWIGEVVGGHPSARDRDAEFATVAADSSQLVQLLQKAGAETRTVFANLDPIELESTREARGRTIPVRWCILHVIDHTALHLGHMQITYQLWNGGQSQPSPRWFERLSSRRENL